MNHNDHSHFHCFDRGGSPACGIALEKHTQCCLCPALKPTHDPNNKECVLNTGENQDLKNCFCPTTGSNGEVERRNRLTNISQEEATELLKKYPDGVHILTPDGEGGDELKTIQEDIYWFMTGIKENNIGNKDDWKGMEFELNLMKKDFEKILRTAISRAREEKDEYYKGVLDKWQEDRKFDIQDDRLSLLSTIRAWVRKYMKETTMHYGTDKHGVDPDDLLQFLSTLSEKK